MAEQVVHCKIDDELLLKIDAVRLAQPFVVSRSTAIRQLVRFALGALDRDSDAAVTGVPAVAAMASDQVDRQVSA